MAKQTFTTGQVLTAAQMTSLQQTAMGGGEATAKTASYVLVAADAGTTVIMNAAGATTITVNTALFAAGDTVNIQNIGAGICTVTAGTATVNTAGSLALNQYEGGVLYFRITSATTFFDYVQTGSVSPLTTKGDLYGFSTLDARVPIGTNNQVLTADSAEALGLKWATPTGFTGVYTSYTPVITQSGTVTKTVTFAEYIQVGVFVHAMFRVGITGSGTAANQITVTLPFAPASSYGTLGVGYVYDASANLVYSGQVVPNTGTAVSFQSATNAGLAYLGASVFTAALASSDEIVIDVVYRSS